MFKEAPIARGVRLALGGGMVGLALIASVADAQTVQQGERVEVTGSNIRRTDTETASPLQVLTRDDIERTGKQNIGDVIRSISADGQGSLPTAFSAGFAAGSAGVSLRGLGLNSTLVLLNGRRMAPYGLADDGARTFVDLNTIPLDAVERIEIVKDGASAIYGSDAIGGVVNIILRSEYTGGTVNVLGGTSYKGDGTTGRVAGTFGFGNLDTDRYNVFASLEASKQEHINQQTRPDYLGTNDLRGIGFFDNRRGSPAAGRGVFADGSGPNFSGQTKYGTVRVPGGTLSERINLLPCPEINPDTGVCTQDLINYAEVQPKVERLNFFSRGSFAITPKATAYLDVGLFKDRVESIGTPGGVGDGGVFNPDDPTNPTVHTTVLPATYPLNPTGVARTLTYSTDDFGGRNSTTDSLVKRFVGGIKGEFEKFNYDLGVMYTSSDLKQTQTGFIRYSALQSAINNNSYILGQANSLSQDQRDAISPKLQQESLATVKLVDFHLSRPIFSLPGGDLQVAVGAEYRKEETRRPPTPYTDIADIVGLGYSAYSGVREVKAAFAEIDAPIFKWLEINGAIRDDKYSDVGNSLTPKVGIKLKPIDQVAIRASYAKAFRAPGPTEAGNSSTLGFTNIAIISIGDPSVKPERAKSYGLGLVLEPFKGTSASIDYWRIRRTNEIVQADQGSIIGNAPFSDPLLAGQTINGAQPNSRIFYDVNGDLAGVLGPYANASSTKTEGIDYNIKQRFNLGEYGKLTLDANWTHTIKFRRTLADGTTFEYAGTQGPYVLSAAAGTPKDKGNLALTWERGPVSGTVQVNYVGPLDGVDHKGETMVDNEDGTFSTTTFEGAYITDGSQVCGVFYPNGGPAPGNCRIRSFTTVDLYGKYTGIKNWEFTASVQNLFNLKAPFDPYTYGGVNYNPTIHQAGAVGMFITLGARYSF